MRRHDREITDTAEKVKIIAAARYLHLGMFDGEYPYVVPLHYGYRMQEGKPIFYVHCAKEGHKLDCLAANPHVFVQIDTGETMVAADIPCGYGAEYESVMCKGTASAVEDPEEKCEALRLLMKHQTGEDFVFTPQMADGVMVLRIDAADCTAKARRAAR